MSSEPVNMPMTEIEKAVGKFIVLFRNNEKCPAKIIRVDIPNKRVVYEILTGPNAGTKWNSRFDESQSAVVYDEGNLMLALMDTDG